MRRKLYLSVFLFCLLGVGVMRVQAQTSMTLKFQDGTEKSAGLSAVNKITFSDSGLFMNYVGCSNESFTLNSIRKIVFGTSMGTSSILSDKQDIIVYPNPATNYIALKKAPEGELSVAIYRLDGAQMMNVQFSSASETIDVSRLEKGFYFLKVNNKAFKFTKL